MWSLPGRQPCGLVGPVVVVFVPRYLQNSQFHPSTLPTLLQLSLLAVTERAESFISQQVNFCGSDSDPSSSQVSQIHVIPGATAQPHLQFGRS